MNNHKHNTSNNTNQNSSDHNTIDAVEQVYPAEAIDIIECVNNQAYLVNDPQFNTQQQAANDPLANADVYSMDSARMAKHDRSAERRTNKSQLTDRRSSARLSADGEVQQDRRAQNRAANIESIRLAKAMNAAETP